MVRSMAQFELHQQDAVSWLALTFELEDGSWRLVFDQSTLIQP